MKNVEKKRMNDLEKKKKKKKKKEKKQGMKIKTSE